MTPRRPLPPIAPCNRCGRKPRARKHRVFTEWTVDCRCGMRGPVRRTERGCILAWNPRSDAEAERRGAMQAARWALKHLRISELRDAIERGEVLLEKPEPWIVSTPGVMGGKPRVRGTRITVETLQSAAREWTSQQILEQYPGLTAEGLAAALAYEMPKTKARKR